MLDNFFSCERLHVPLQLQIYSKNTKHLGLGCDDTKLLGGLSCWLEIEESKPMEFDDFDGAHHVQNSTSIVFQECMEFIPVWNKQFEIGHGPQPRWTCCRHRVPPIGGSRANLGCAATVTY